jgi:hypothetical protein
LTDVSGELIASVTSNVAPIGSSGPTCIILLTYVFVFLQDVHQLLMLSAGTSMYLKQILFPLDIFNNNCGTIHILDTNCIELYKFLDLVSCLFVFVCMISSPFNQIDLI